MAPLDKHAVGFGAVIAAGLAISLLVAILAPLWAVGLFLIAIAVAGILAVALGGAN